MPSALQPFSPSLQSGSQTDRVSGTTSHVHADDDELIVEVVVAVDVAVDVASVVDVTVVVKFAA